MLKQLTLFFVSISTSIGVQAEKKQNPSDFIPHGYVLNEKIVGDLNQDGLEDIALIIKGTNKENIVINRFDNEVDRNRRGIIVLLNKNGHYELATQNCDCFYSENEDGGIYYAPELSVYIETGDLIINYNHGRYGHWQYTFRYQNANFELIEYYSVSGGAITDRITHVNYVTKKKQLQVNINENDEGGDEIFEETWEDIEVDKLTKLSEIKAFEDF